MDIEGSELNVLQGGFEMLRKCRPVIYLEAQRHQAGGIAAFLKAAGYRLFDPAVSAPDRRDLTELTYNVLALPR